MSADHVVRTFDAAAGAGELQVPTVVGTQLRQGLCAVIAMSGAAQASHDADEQVLPALRQRSSLMPFPLGRSWWRKQTRRQRCVASCRANCRRRRRRTLVDLLLPIELSCRVFVCAFLGRT